MISGSGSKPTGVANLMSNPSIAHPNAKSCKTLFPSPTHATCPFTLSEFSTIVIMSAAAWQGWWRSERALITGIVECFASSMTSSCPKHRYVMQSKYLERTAAVSAIVSLFPSCRSPERRVIGCPPSLFTPTSKDTLVLVDGFS